jgi:hypothetical protein
MIGLAFFCYLLGSVPFGLILTRLAGLGDVRAIGSGNIGATNVLRTGNKGLAALTLVFDMAKAMVPIMLLADHFLARFNEMYSKQLRRISTTAINMMMSYHWPGNVRELENCIERAVLTTTDDVIHGYTLPPSLQTSEQTQFGARILNTPMVAAEVLNILVGSFGLVTVAPFTALVAAALFRGRRA